MDSKLKPAFETLMDSKLKPAFETLMDSKLKPDFKILFQTKYFAANKYIHTTYENDLGLSVLELERFVKLLKEKCFLEEKIAEFINITPIFGMHYFNYDSTLQTSLEEIVCKLLRYFNIDELPFLKRGLYVYKKNQKNKLVLVNDLPCDDSDEESIISGAVIFFLTGEVYNLKKKYEQSSRPIRGYEEARSEFKKLLFIPCKYPCELEKLDLRQGYFSFVISSKSIEEMGLDYYLFNSEKNHFMYGVRSSLFAYDLDKFSISKNKSKSTLAIREMVSERKPLLSYYDPDSECTKKLPGCYLNFVYKEQNKIVLTKRSNWVGLAKLTEHPIVLRDRWIKKLARCLGYSVEWLDKPMKKYGVVIFYGPLIKDLIEFFSIERLELLVSGYINRINHEFGKLNFLNELLLVFLSCAPKNNVFMFFKDLSPLLRNTIGLLFKFFGKPFLMELARDIKNFSSKNEDFDLEDTLKNPKKSEYFKKEAFKNLCEKHGLSTNDVCKQIKQAAAECFVNCLG